MAWSGTEYLQVCSRNVDQCAQGGNYGIVFDTSGAGSGTLPSYTFTLMYFPGRSARVFDTLSSGYHSYGWPCWAAGSFWCTKGTTLSSLLQIDPSTGAVTAISTPTNLQGWRCAALGGGIWLFNPTSNTAPRRYDLSAGTWSTGTAVGSAAWIPIVYGGYIWFGTPAGHAVKFDASTGTAVDTISGTFDGVPAGIGDRVFWSDSSSSATLQWIDVTTDLSGSYALGKPSNSCWVAANDTLYTLSLDGSSMTGVRPSDMRIYNDALPTSRGRRFLLLYDSGHDEVVIPSGEPT